MTITKITKEQSIYLRLGRLENENKKLKEQLGNLKKSQTKLTNAQTMNRKDLDIFMENLYRISKNYIQKDRRRKEGDLD